MNSITPIFIFSLPRAGSTLLQRVLASHEKISTVSEPWILLPLVYALKNEGVYAEYSHVALNKALTDFFREMPKGAEDYLDAMRVAVLDLYEKAAREDATFFLDKTPRYHLICDAVIRMFPEGKFIFLWRNPLSVVASISESWGKGRWNLFRYEIDLLTGVGNLVTAFSKHKEKVISVNYEQLLSEPKQELSRIYKYIGLSPNEQAIHQFIDSKLIGNLGDKTGIEQYTQLSSEPITKWKVVINNSFRIYCCRKYLHWIGRERLATMGYQLDILIRDLESIPRRIITIFRDLVDASYDIVVAALKKKILKSK